MFQKSKESLDKQLSSLMELAGELALRLNKEGDILCASDRATTMLVTDGPLVGMSLFELVQLPDRHAMEAALRQAVLSLQLTRVSVRLVTPATVLWFELQMMACDAATNVEILVVGRDISSQ